MIKQKAEKLNEQQIHILSFKTEYKTYFEKYNKEWINESFNLEEIDKYVLENPEESIIQNGGKILFAESNGIIIGTVALMRINKEVVELTKMAVGKQWQGLGAGKLLCINAILEAKKMKVSQIILYSNTKLKKAINLYKKLGFKELELETGIYNRANIKMSMTITN